MKRTGNRRSNGCTGPLEVGEAGQGEYQPRRPDAARNPHSLIVEDRRRQFVVNNDVEQVADLTVATAVAQSPLVTEC